MAEKPERVNLNTQGALDLHLQLERTADVEDEDMLLEDISKRCALHMLTVSLSEERFLCPRHSLVMMYSTALGNV